MPNVAILNMAGESVGTMELSENVFGAEINKSAVHQVVVNYLANQRQGTQSTKTRTEVRGGGRKPWRQKGTGRARQGSIRAPQWTGGGVALGPKPRSYRYTLNKKLRRIALKSVLTAKVADGELIVIDDIKVDEIKTKTIVNMLENINAKKALIVTENVDKNVYLSTRNIPSVETTFANTINVYQILKYDYLVASKAAISKIEEVYA